MKTETIGLDQLTIILEASTIIETTNQTGMLSHACDHPTLGNITTVQSDNTCLLITA